MNKELLLEIGLLALVLFIACYLFNTVFKVHKKIEMSPEEMQNMNDAYYQNGYNSAINAMKYNSQSNTPQAMYDICNHTSQNSFDRGWMQACIDKGAKKVNTHE